MSPRIILFWMSWEFILTSFVNCDSIDNDLHDVFRRLTYIENVLVNSASNGNSNTNCNRNKINVGKRNSMHAIGDREDDDDDIDRKDLHDTRNYDDVGINDDSAHRGGFKFRKMKKKRGRHNNRDKAYSADGYYSYVNLKANRNVNKNHNVNVNKNVISRRSDQGA